MSALFDSAMRKLQRALGADRRLQLRFQAAPGQALREIPGLTHQERAAIVQRPRVDWAPAALRAAALAASPADRYAGGAMPPGTEFQTALTKLTQDAEHDPRLARALAGATKQTISAHASLRDGDRSALTKLPVDRLAKVGVEALNNAMRPQRPGQTASSGPPGPGRRSGASAPRSSATTRVAYTHASEHARERALIKIVRRLKADPTFASSLAKTQATIQELVPELLEEESTAIRHLPPQELTAACREVAQRDLLETWRLSPPQVRPGRRRPAPMIRAVGAPVTTRIQQLVGDIDVAKLQAGQAFVPKAVNPVTMLPSLAAGFYLGAPTFATVAPDGSDDSNISLWTDPNAADHQAFADTHTSILSGVTYNVFASDKAHSFTDNDSNIIFLFGDVLGLSSAEAGGPFDTIGKAYRVDGALQNDDGSLRSFAFFQSKHASGSLDGRQPANQNNFFTFVVQPNGYNPFTFQAFSSLDMGPDNTAYSGLSVPGGPTYVVMRVNVALITNRYFTNKPARNIQEAAILTRFDQDDTDKIYTNPLTAFTYLRTLSQLPWEPYKSSEFVGKLSGRPLLTNSSRFIQQALHWYDSSYGQNEGFGSSNLPDLGPGNGYILTFGTGTFHGPAIWADTSKSPPGIVYTDWSTIYLGATPYGLPWGNPPDPAFVFEQGVGPMLFLGLDEHDVPQWTHAWFPDESLAAPLLWAPSPAGLPYINGQPHGIGDFSVVYVSDPTGGQLSPTGGFWLMLFDQHGSGAIQFSWAVSPWGIWSAPIPVFSKADGDGSQSFSGPPFMCRTDRQGHLLNGVSGPTLPNATLGAFQPYGPMLVEALCKVSEHYPFTFTLHWTVCTSQPYYAVMMKTVLQTA